MTTTTTTTATARPRIKLDRVRAGFYRTTDGRFSVLRINKRGGWSVHDDQTETYPGFALVVSHCSDTLDCARTEIRRHLRREAERQARATR